MLKARTGPDKWTNKDEEEFKNFLAAELEKVYTFQKQQVCRPACLHVVQLLTRFADLRAHDTHQTR